MKVSRAQAAENRDAIVRVAAEQMRRLGMGRMSVASVASGAGLTHGALYSHFDSRTALQAEALRHAFAECRAGFETLTIGEVIARYLSPDHRDGPGQGCPVPSLVSEVSTQSAQTQAAFQEGVDRFRDLLATQLGGDDPARDRERATFVLAALVGGLALARALRPAGDEASDDVLRVVAEQITQALAA